MKHAGPETLLALHGLLSQLRLLPGLVEKRPGVFYAKSRACVHFHEDPLGMFADVRLGGDAFDRFPVNTAAQQAAVLKAVSRAHGRLVDGPRQ